MAVLNLKNLWLPPVVMPIITTSLKELSPERAIYKNFFEDYGVKTPIQRALFIGKCAIPLYKNFSKIMPDIPSFVYSTKPRQKIVNEKAIVRFGTHPYPSLENFEISMELKSWLNKTKGDTAVFVSGGSSSLLFLPEKKCFAEELIEVEEKLLSKRIPIKKLNFVRMAISQLRGGGVAELIQPYNFFGFVWCDMEPKDFKFVGSAPLGGIAIDFKKEAEKILEKNKIQIPFEINRTKMKSLPDGSFIYKLADGIKLCQLVEKRIGEIGVNGKIIKIKEGTSSINAAEIIFSESQKIKRPSVLIGNGEFLENIIKGGRGGRCSHLAANVAKLFHKKKKWFFAALATDGVDGSGDGGAFIHSEEKLDISEIEKAIANFDTANYFRKRGLFFERKPTRNNLRDLWVLTLE